MQVNKQEFETAVRSLQDAVNYAGMDQQLAQASGGNFEDHYLYQNGVRVCVASATHQKGSYSLANNVVAQCLPQRMLCVA